MTYTLHYAPDNASLIVRLALEELGVPYHALLVDRRKNAQKSKAYLALNPSGRIPVLETMDGPIFETGAILMWLVDQHQALGPAPTDAERPVFLSWLFYVSNTLHPDLIALFYPERYADPDTGTDFTLRTQNRVDAAFRVIDAAYPNWGAHDAATNVIELYVATALRWCQLYPISACNWFDISDYPALFAMAKKLEQRPAIHAAILAEGLNETPFSCAQYATPTEGSAV